MRPALVALVLCAVAAPALCQRAVAPVPACAPGFAPTPAPLASTAPSTPGPLGNCQLSPGDGSTCSQNPCSFCAGLPAGVYPDPNNNCTTSYDCYPTGAECLKCYNGQGSAGTTQCPLAANCPATAPIAPAYCESVAPSTAVTSTTPATPATSGSCTVTPGDGSTCSSSPCTFCSGKAAGVYADTASGCSTYFDCTGSTSASCLKCYGTYGTGSQCPGSGSSCVANGSPGTTTPATPVTTPAVTSTPATPATTTPSTPASTGSCTVQPGDGSTCSQNPCTFCAGKPAGVVADTGSGCSKTYYSCAGGTSAECLKCYSSGYTTQCPASSSCTSTAG